jgi:uncharacterized Tic20 family protein
MLAHIGALVAGLVALAFLGPLIVMLTQGARSPFVRRHAVESLNFQITLIIAFLVGSIVGAILAIITLGLALIILIPLALAVGIGALVLIIKAGIKANNGEEYRYPFTLRLVS